VRIEAGIPWQHFPCSILVTSSPTRPTRSISSRGSSRGCRACLACRATSPFSLPRAYLIGRPAICCGVYVVIPVCPCVVSFSNFHEPDTHDLLRTSRQHPRSIHVRHTRFHRDMLATSSQVLTTVDDDRRLLTTLSVHAALCTR